MKLRNLIKVNELDFSSQAEFDNYKKNHKMRPSTKVNIAGKQTTVANASKGDGKSNVFGKKTNNPTKTKGSSVYDTADVQSDSISLKLKNGKDFKIEKNKIPAAFGGAQTFNAISKVIKANDYKQADAIIQALQVHQDLIGGKKATLKPKS